MPSYQKSDKGISNAMLLALILLLVAVNMVIILLCRRFLNKELTKEMEIQVSSQVSQYIALSSLEGENNMISQNALDETKVDSEDKVEDKTQIKS